MEDQLFASRCARYYITDIKASATGKYLYSVQIGYCSSTPASVEVLRPSLKITDIEELKLFLEEFGIDTERDPNVATPLNTTKTPLKFISVEEIVNRFQVSRSPDPQYFTTNISRERLEEYIQAWEKRH